MENAKQHVLVCSDSGANLDWLYEKSSTLPFILPLYHVSTLLLRLPSSTKTPLSSSTLSLNLSPTSSI